MSRPGYIVLATTVGALMLAPAVHHGARSDEIPDSVARAPHRHTDNSPHR